MDDPYAVRPTRVPEDGRRGRRRHRRGVREARQPLAGPDGGRGDDPGCRLRPDRPPDEDPGAAQAGVVAFIDRQLATRRTKDRPLFQAGVRGLDATARRRHGQPFAALPFDAQTAVLQDVEKGAVEAADWEGVEPGVFFGRLREHTMMGFYGDPRHGGNKDRVSWKMLGVPDPPIRGRLHETPPPPALAPRPSPLPVPRKG